MLEIHSARFDEELEALFERYVADTGLSESEALRRLVSVGLDREALAESIASKTTGALSSGLVGAVRSEVGEGMSGFSDALDKVAQNASLARRQSLNSAEAALGALMGIAFLMRDASGGEMPEGWSDLVCDDIYRVFFRAGGALSRNPIDGIPRGFQDLEKWGYEPMGLVGTTTEEMRHKLAGDDLSGVARRDEKIRRSRKKGGR